MAAAGCKIPMQEKLHAVQGHSPILGLPVRCGCAAPLGKVKHQQYDIRPSLCADEAQTCHWPLMIARTDQQSLRAWSEPMTLAHVWCMFSLLSKRRDNKAKWKRAFSHMLQGVPQQRLTRSARQGMHQGGCPPSPLELQSSMQHYFSHHARSPPPHMVCLSNCIVFLVSFVPSVCK